MRKKEKGAKTDANGKPEEQEAERKFPLAVGAGICTKKGNRDPMADEAGITPQILGRSVSLHAVEAGSTNPPVAVGAGSTAETDKAKQGMP